MDLPGVITMKKHSFLSFVLAVILTMPFIGICHAECYDDSWLFPGDVTRDGVVNAMDVQCLSMHLLGIDKDNFCIENADVNQNGTVNALDLVYLIWIILGVDPQSFVTQIVSAHDDLISEISDRIKGTSELISDIFSPPVSETETSEQIQQPPGGTESTDTTENDNVTDISVDSNIPDVQETEMDAVFRLINDIRIQNGLNPFEKSEILDLTAMQRASEIAQKFSHIRPDGSSCFTLLDENDVFYMAAGENIACGSSTAASVVEQWMNSKGHRENILNSNYDHLGVGFFKEEGSNYCWTQIFTG